MRVLVSALIIILIMSVFIGYHAYTMKILSDDIISECNKIEKLIQKDNWNEINFILDKINNIWNKKRTWISLTISTKEIEQIEISLKQCSEYAKIGQKPDFIGEFVMFSMLVDHIPHQEGFNIEELL